MPPSSTPTAAPLPDAAPQMPSARLRSRPSAKRVMSSDRPAGANSAPPMPWIARKTISELGDQAIPQSAEAMVKRVRPATKRRRRPSRSARRPPRSRKPPNVSA